LTVGLVLVLAVVGGVGYFAWQARAEQERREELQQKELALVQAAAEAESNRRAQQRNDVLNNPNAFLDVSDIHSFDKGIINDYRQLVGFTVLNKSPFHLKAVKGDVEWLDGKGESIGSTPFTVNGSIPSGDTKKLRTNDGTLSSGTIQGNADKVKLKFTHVEIVE
jgi:hypothetical protein